MLQILYPKGEGERVLSKPVPATPTVVNYHYGIDISSLHRRVVLSANQLLLVKSPYVGGSTHNWSYTFIASWIVN